MLTSIQSYAEIIAQVIGTDVEIMNSVMVRVAGTGVYAKGIGQPIVRPDNIYDEVLRCRKTVMIDSPRQHTLCRRCPKRGTCKKRFVLATPIMEGDNMFGIIGLVCFNEFDRSRIMTSLEKYCSFVSFLANTLTTNISQTNKLNRASHCLEVISLAADIQDRGILAFDPEGGFLFANTLARDVFGITEDKVPSPDDIRRSGGGVYGYEEFEVNAPGGKVSGLPGCMAVLDAKSSAFVFERPSRLARLAGKISSSAFGINLDAIIGAPKALVSLKEAVLQAAESDSPLLITGEAGTGKELLARAIHYSGPRKGAPFITVNCGAIPASLLESELFGHAGGSLAGAPYTGKMSKFELANGGIVFLDAISSMPMYIQRKLLLVLRNREVVRLGSDRAIAIDVRVIAARGEDCFMKAGREAFLEELLEQFDTEPLHIPRLCERREDIAVLTGFFLDRYCELMQKRVPRLRTGVLRLLEKYDWPGNVRELERAIEYAVHKMPPGGALDIGCIPDKLLENIRKRKTGSAVNGHGRNSAVTSKGEEVIPLRQLEEAALRNALGHFGDSAEGKKQAARSLGLSPAIFHRKLREFSI